VAGGVAPAGPPAMTGDAAALGVRKIGGEAPCTGDILGLPIGLGRGLPIGLCAAAAAHIDEMSNIIITPLVTAAILLVEVLKRAIANKLLKAACLNVESSNAKYICS
jgi:hypothetical protein